MNTTALLFLPALGHGSMLNKKYIGPVTLISTPTSVPSQDTLFFMVAGINNTVHFISSVGAKIVKRAKLGTKYNLYLTCTDNRTVTYYTLEK